MVKAGLSLLLLSGMAALHHALGQWAHTKKIIAFSSVQISGCGLKFPSWETMRAYFIN